MPTSKLYGLYSSDGDISEKEKEYRFDIYKDGELIESSGWCIHNVNNNNDIYFVETNLFTDAYYIFKYRVKTINDLEISSPSYCCYGDSGYCPTSLPEKCGSKIKNVYDDGIVAISLIADFEAKKDLELAGQYRLLRLSEGYFDVLADITCNTRLAPGETLLLHEDFTVEHGKTYKYYLQ
jgi:hypothetical protein